MMGRAWLSWRPQWHCHRHRLITLAVARGLAEAAYLGARLSIGDIASLSVMPLTTIRHWTSGQRIRPGFGMEQRKDDAPILWRVVAELKPNQGKKTHL